MFPTNHAPCVAPPGAQPRSRRLSPRDPDLDPLANKVESCQTGQRAQIRADGEFIRTSTLVLSSRPVQPAPVDITLFFPHSYAKYYCCKRVRFVLLLLYSIVLA